MDCLLQARSLGHRYQDHPALSGFDLCAQPGEIIGLFGGNGAGKSTVLAILGGMQAPDEGEVRLRGERLYGGPLALRKRIGYLPQAPILYPDLTVEENLRLAASLRGIRRADRTGVVEDQLAHWELVPFRRRLGSQLSTGMARRTALGMTLVHSPELLLLDEPTSGLDPAQADRLRRHLLRYAEKRVIVMASHLARDIEQACSRALVLKDGKTVMEESLRPDRMVALVEFGRPPPDAQLLAIDGVMDARPLGAGEPNHLRLLHLEVRSERPWAEIFAGRDWDLRRFEPRRSVLSGDFGAEPRA